jgi:nucleoid DNA-binding protein
MKAVEEAVYKEERGVLVGFGSFEIVKFKAKEKLNEAALKS